MHGGEPRRGFGVLPEESWRGRGTSFPGGGVPMGWTPPPDGIAVWQGGGVVYRPEGGASMEQVSIIGIDLAKHGFQLHGARLDGSVAFRKWI